MLTEKEIRRAGCGCGCAEKWLTGDVRTGPGDSRTKEQAPPTHAEQNNVTGLYGSCLGKRCNLLPCASLFLNTQNSTAT